jgi:hypothetical protein
MADIKYPDSTPVDESVAKPKPKAAAKPAPKASAPVQYPDSVPVDEPVASDKKKAGGKVKKMASGGGTNYTDTLRNQREVVEQSDSGVMRSDDTAARLKDYDNRIRQSEAAGAGRGSQGVTKMAKGGSASSRADGCCIKGKTKGMFV